MARPTPGTIFPSTMSAGMPNTKSIIPVAERILEKPSKKMPIEASTSPFPHQRYLNFMLHTPSYVSLLFLGAVPLPQS